MSLPSSISDMEPVSSVKACVILCGGALRPDDRSLTPAETRAEITSGSPVRDDREGGVERPQDAEMLGPACLLPLLDKSIIQHCVETAVRCGVERIDVVAAEGTADIRELLGEGCRWGIRISIHSMESAVMYQRALSMIGGRSGLSADSPILLLNGGRLLPGLAEESRLTAGQPTVWKDSRQHWAAAVLPHGALPCVSDRLSRGETATDALASVVRSRRGECCETDALVVFPLDELRVAQKRVLDNEFPVLTNHLRSGEDGIWIGRNVRLHPTTRIVKPAFIGENSEVGRACIIGPNAVISRDTLLLDEVTARDCLVLPWTTVGTDLNLTDCIAEPHCVYNAHHRLAVPIYDGVLVGSLKSSDQNQGRSRLPHQCLAAIAWVLLAGPARLYREWLSWCGRAPEPVRERVCQGGVSESRRQSAETELVRYVPATVRRGRSDSIRGQWEDLWLRIVPALPAVVQGRLALVGTTPRTASAFSRIPLQWREMLGATRAGLFTESLLQYGPRADAEQRVVCDVYHSVASHRFALVKILCRYLRTLLSGPATRRGVGYHNTEVEGPSRSRPVQVLAFESEARPVGQADVIPDYSEEAALCSR